MKLIMLLMLSLFHLTASASPSFDIGVYYYPGWDQPNDPWQKIKPFKDREPLLGWYKEGSAENTKIQIDWMHQYGINFVIYDWYWDNIHGVNRTHAIDSFSRLKDTHDIKFTLLWANHTGTPSSLKQFDDIVQYWIDHYFRAPGYKKIDGKPVVFIFSSELLERDARNFGSNANELLERARDRAIQEGLPGIYFVGSIKAGDRFSQEILPLQNYDALSAYNYQLNAAEKLSERRPSASYKELSDGYEQAWNSALSASKLPYLIPVTSGWDKTPWGGSESPNHDNSSSTPEQFRLHLESAKSLITSEPKKTLSTVVICCWNEYGEGSYIEPTKKYKFQYLEQIKNTFKISDSSENPSH